MGTANAQVHPDEGNDEMCDKESSIESFFADSIVLVTGATGFVGKALVEKLLRACPRLAMIFILIRPKQKQTVEERYKSFLTQSVFDTIRSTKLLSKVHPIKGDVSQPDLGLSAEDRKMLLEKVNVIFHVAATVRFNEPLKVAVDLNLKGTVRIVQLAKSMKNLISMVHVSTAYSNSNRDEIAEAIYPTKVKPSTMIDMCEDLDEETLKVLEEKILENHPNTYTFTKNLAEQYLLSEGTSLPLSIVRPSIIGAAEKEPTPGWVDNIFGLTGPIMEVGRGAVKSYLCNANLKLDVIPVDHVVHTFICAAWYNTQQKNKAIKIYNCTNNAQPIRWFTVNEFAKKAAIESPSKYIMWYPCCVCRMNKLIHYFINFTMNLVPAFLSDLFVRLKGGKPMMMKLIKRVDRMGQATQFFTTHEWTFHKDNLNELKKQIKVLKDCDNFAVGPTYIDWQAYLKSYMLGIRYFVLNDPPETLKTARSRLYMFYWLHKFSQVFSVVAILALIIRIIY